MKPSLDEILDDQNDEELCGRLFDRIVEFHGTDCDLSQANPPERTVALVWDAMGRIDNGGFTQLFAAAARHDPEFALTARAIEQIGCAAAVEAFRLAFSTFDGSRDRVLRNRPMHAVMFSTGQNRPRAVTIKPLRGRPRAA